MKKHPVRQIQAQFWALSIQPKFAHNRQDSHEKEVSTRKTKTVSSVNQTVESKLEFKHNRLSFSKQ